MIIHANLQSNLSISLGGEDFKVFAFGCHGNQFCMDLLHLSNFDRGPSKDYLCEVLSNFA